MQPDLWFDCPLLLLLIAAPLALALWLWRTRPRAVLYPAAALVGQLPHSLRERLRPAPALLRLLALGLLVVAIAGPLNSKQREIVTPAGVDVVVVLDVSRSMLAEDLVPNRLGAAKRAARELIESRPLDRIGLVAFAARAASVCPLTLDHQAAIEALESLQEFETDEGTALGPALVLALRREGAASGRDRVVVLLTDGASNRGEPSPRQAALASAYLGVRIYTVGVGSDAPAWYPTEFGRLLVRLPVEDATLKEVARVSGGRSYRAGTAGSLEAITGDIDRLETGSTLTTREVRPSNSFAWWILTALVLVLVAEWLAATSLRSAT